MTECGYTHEGVGAQCAAECGYVHECGVIDECVDVYVVSMGEYMKCVSACVSVYGSMSVWQCPYGERECV